MIYPEYIKGTSLIGYFNQMIAINAFSSRFLLSNKHRKYQRRKSSAYIAPYLTETYTSSLAGDLGNIIPNDVMSKLREYAEDAVKPFDPASITTFDFLLDRELKYCPECMKNGEHYYSQQMITEDKCRKHGEPLQKGCPRCGKSIRASVEITDLDAFICPNCYMRIADFSSPADLVTKLFKVKDAETDLKRNTQFNSKGYLAAMSGAESGFSQPNVRNILKEYLDTGIIPEGLITVQKGEGAEITLSELVFAYTEEQLCKGAKRFEMIDYIERSEASDSASVKASAYLVRMLIGYWSPKRVGVKQLKHVESDIRKSLQRAGLIQTDDVVYTVLRQYVRDMYISLKQMFEDHSGDSILLLAHEQIIPDIRYAMMILEDDSNYYLYIHN